MMWSSRGQEAMSAGIGGGHSRGRGSWVGIDAGMPWIETRMLLSVLQCTGPAYRDYLAPNARIEES